MMFHSIPINTIKLIPINNQKTGVNNSFLIPNRIAINTKILTPINILKKIKKFWLDHTAVIKRFGRYPHRNKVLNRVSSNDEVEFLNLPNSSW